MKTQLQGPFRTNKAAPRRWWRHWHWLQPTMAVVVVWLSFAGAPQVRAASTPMSFVVFYLFDVYNALGSGTNGIGSNSGGAASLCALCLAAPPIGSHFAKASANSSSSVDVLYGTASLGGSGSQGTVFSVNSDGTGYTVLHNFAGSDGAFPTAGMILSGNTLYGTTVNGGSSDNGTVFAINTNKTGFTILHSFTARSHSPYTNSDGGNPHSALILSGNTLYGTTTDGGTGNAGTVFAINLANTNFTVLHQFAAAAYDPNNNYIVTNSDGSAPFARLILSGQTLFGTTSQGGPGGVGSVFAVNTNGANFTVLHNFSALDQIYNTNTDGSAPAAGLIVSGSTLYGTAYQGGSANSGTIFSVNTNGANFTNLYNFTGGTDGSEPAGDLVLSGSTLFGTTRIGGNATMANGTVFALDVDTRNFAVVHTFAAGGYDPNLPAIGNNMTNSDGAIPQAGLALSDSGTLYGSTSSGGPGGNGSIFSLSPAELSILGITLSGTNLVINGSNGQSGGAYVTRMSTNLSQSLNLWAPVATNTLNADGNFTFTATNAVNTKAKQQFYILQTQ